MAGRKPLMSLLIRAVSALGEGIASIPPLVSEGFVVSCCWSHLAEPDFMWLNACTTQVLQCRMLFLTMGCIHTQSSCLHCMQLSFILLMLQQLMTSYT